MPPTASSGVMALVASIKQRVKFKQLAGYSVNTLVKAITPPTVGWESALREAYEAGALEAITEVLKLHAGDEEITAAATAALTAIAADGQYATAVVESGAMMGLMGSVVANPGLKKGVKETIALFEKVASTAPRALLAAGGVDAATRLLEIAPKDPVLAPPCMRVLDQLVKEQEGAPALMECDSLRAIFSVLTSTQDEGLLDVSLRVVDRLSRVPEYAEVIRTTHNGLQCLCAVISRQREDSKVKGVGGRLLAKLASANVAELVAKMLAATEASEKEFMASLLANLALESEYSARILDSGGLSALCQVLALSAASNPKTSEAAARALSRLVATEAHASELIASSAVQVLVACLGSPGASAPGGDALASAATSALARISSRGPGAAAAVYAQGGVQAVVRQLAAQPGQAMHTLFALALLEDMLTLPGEGWEGKDVPWVDASALLGYGALAAIAGALAAHPGHPGIALNGTRCLIYLSFSAATVEGMCSAGASEAVLLNLAVPPAGGEAEEAVRKEGSSSSGSGSGSGYKEPSPELLAASMYLMTQFALTERGKAVIGLGGGETIMAAVSHFTRVMGSLGEESAVGSVAQVAEELMLAVVTRAQVVAALADLGRLTDSVASTRSKVDCSKLRTVVTHIAAFAATPLFAEAMLDSGALPSILHTIEAISACTGLPDGERVLVACAGALQGTVRSVEAAASGGSSGEADASARALAALGEAGAGRILCGAIKAAPRMLRFSSEAMGLLAYMSQSEALGDEICTSAGGVDACCAVLRANPTSASAISADVLSTMLALSSTDKGVLALAKQGGTRQVIASIHANVGDAAFAGAVLEKAVTLLSRVAATTEGAELLVRQGGVDAIVEAAAELERHSEPGGGGAEAAEETLSALVGVLGRLLGKEEVRKASEGVRALAGAAAAGQAELTSDVLRSHLIKMPVIASVPAFLPILTAAGVPEALLSLNAALLAPGFDPAASASGLGLSFKALAQLARGAGGLPVASAAPYAAQALAAIDSGACLTPCLDFVRSAAGSSEALAAGLAGDGTTLPLLAATIKANMRVKDVSSAAFRALAALGSHASTAVALAATPALGLACEWLEENAEDGAEEAVGAALSVLGVVAGAGGGSGEGHTEAVLESIRGVLAARCVEGSAPAPNILASSCSVLQRIAELNAAAAARLAASGLVQRTVRALNLDRRRYLGTPGTALGALGLITSAARLGGEALAQLSEESAVELVLAAMNANFTDSSVLAAGGEALVALGAGEDAARLAVAELRELLGRLESVGLGRGDEALLAGLGDSALRLSSLAGIPGVVTAASAPGLLEGLSSALEHLTASPAASSSALNSTLQALGRVLELAGEGGGAEGTAGRCVAAIIAALGSRKAGNVGVRTTGIHSLGQAVGGRAGAEALMRLGGLKVVSDTAKKHHSDARLQSVAAAATKKISAAATRWASSSLATPEGLASLTALLTAHAGDPEALLGVLGDILGAPGGSEAILGVIASGSVGGEVLAAALGVLAKEGDGVSKKECSTGRVRALLEAINAALALQATLTHKSDGRSKWRAFEVSTSALSLLSRTGWQKRSAEDFLGGGGAAVLMQLLAANRDDAGTVSTVLGVMAGLTGCGLSAESLAGLAPHVRLMADVLRDAISADLDPVVASDALDAIIAITRGLPVEERSVYEKEVLRCAALLARTHAGSSRVQGTITALESAWGKQIADTGAAERAFGGNVTALRALFERARKWQEVVGGDGRPYFFNKETGETVWEAPPELLALKAALKALAECSTVMGEDAVVAEADAATIESMVAAIEQHARAPDTVAGLASALASLASSDANAIKIVDLGGLLALIKVANAFPDHLALLRMVLLLMERVSVLEAYREVIASQGGVDLIILVAIKRHVALEDIALRALTCLSNLACGVPVNVELIMGKGGVKACEAALQAYKEGPRVLEQAMSVLSNLMYRSEPNKLEIGQTCGDEITGVVLDHCSDASLCKMALRALGNLTFCMDNVRFVVEEHHATKAIVASMRAQPQDEDLQSLAMQVLSNCSAAEEPEPELDEHGDPLHAPPDSICHIILREAGCSQVILNLRKFRNQPRLVLDTLACLNNIANDVEVAEKMCKKQGLLKEVLEVVAMYALDTEVLTAAGQLLGTLSFSRECIEGFLQAGLLPLLLSHMEANTDAPSLLAGMQQCIANLVVLEDGREAVRALNAVPVLMGLLESCSAYPDYTREAFKTVTRLCSDSDLSTLIASTSMHILMGAIAVHEEDAKLLDVAFKALSAVAFEQSNLRAIVQHNGIQRIITAITTHPDNAPLMKSAIQSLDNISMASSDNASIVIDEGGKELLEMVMESHKDNTDIQRYGKSALLSMSALEGLARSRNITERAARNKGKAGPAQAEDPLGEFRYLLSAGKIMKIWNSGSSRSVHVLASSDFRSIVWQEVGTTRKLGALELRAVVLVRAGTESRGFKRGMLSMEAAAKPEHCLSVVGDHSNIDLEAGNPKEREKWVAALTKLHEVFKSNPAALHQ